MLCLQCIEGIPAAAEALSLVGYKVQVSKIDPRIRTNAGRLKHLLSVQVVFTTDPWRRTTWNF